MVPFCGSLVFVLAVFQCAEARKLEFAQALFRHGDRAPLHLPYPNDQYTEKSWSRGWGQLTSIGMQQLHELGEFFRHKYVDTGFIPANFSVKEVYLRSSDSDRALVSAQSFLYGMYPAAGGYQWNADTDWQPLPVHGSTPGQPDLLCKPTAIKCSRHETLVAEGDQQSKAVYDAKYADFFSELSKTTGFKNCSYMDINGLFDVQRELIHNMTAMQPDWVYQNWSQYDNRNSMDIITEMRTVRMMNLFNSEEKGRLQGGSVLYTWIQNALAVTESRNDQRMLLYSSHDGVLLALLNAFRASNEMMVPYAAALIMHVYSDNGKYYPELYYRNETTADPYRVLLPWCPEPCEVSQLASGYVNMTVADLSEMMTLCGTPLNVCGSSSSVHSYLHTEHICHSRLRPSSPMVSSMTDYALVRSRSALTRARSVEPTSRLYVTRTSSVPDLTAHFRHSDKYRPQWHTVWQSTPYRWRRDWDLYDDYWYDKYYYFSPLYRSTYSPSRRYYHSDYLPNPYYWSNYGSYWTRYKGYWYDYDYPSYYRRYTSSAFNNYLNYTYTPYRSYLLDSLSTSLNRGLSMYKAGLYRAPQFTVLLIPSRRSISTLDINNALSTTRRLMPTG
ncbi:unnamed protein product [Caenorhabditis sp. 36 PRJEB53466]|nr:unnamed protein product [Caenorhabditis sp. 36 PRJEB53466]